MEKETTIKTIKGFNNELKCRDFQYEVGKTYELPEGEKVEICRSGFHAIKEDTPPLSVFEYYPPVVEMKPARYCEVEASGRIESDGEKIACSQIKIGAEIGIPGLVKAHIEWVKRHVTNENNAEEGQPATAGNYGAATAGDYGAATAGYRGAATAGDYGAATAGDYGAATAGDSGAATAGDYGAATAGYRGAATAGDSGAATAGNYGAATAGNYGAATAGNYGAATSRGSVKVGKNGVGCVRGNGVKIMGGLGAMLTIAVENADNYDIKEWKSFVVDGETIKENTWYTLKDGEIVELNDGKEENDED